MLQKGNALLIAVVLVAVIALGGYYIYNQKILVSNNLQNGYVLATINPQATSGPVSTSDKMTLTILNPGVGAILNSKAVTVSGKTSPYAEIFINDQETKADASGNFALNLALDEGVNNLIVTANDADGNVVEQNLSVNVQTF